MTWCSRSWTERVYLREYGVRHPIDEDYLKIGKLRCLTKDATSFPEIPGLEESPTYVMKFCPVPGYEERLCLATEEGVVTLHDTAGPRFSSTEPRLSIPLRLHANAIFDLTWAPRQADRIVTVSGDQTTVVWDMDAKEKIKTFRGHSKSVKVVNWKSSDDHVFATGK